MYHERVQNLNNAESCKKNNTDEHMTKENVKLKKMKKDSLLHDNILMK